MVPGPMPKFIKLSVLGCLLGMSAGAVIASSLRDVSATRLSGEAAIEGAAEGSAVSPRPARAASSAGVGQNRRFREASGGFEAPPLHAIPAQSPNAPLPPSWQSLLPGAIRL